MQSINRLLSAVSPRKVGPHEPASRLSFAVGAFIMTTAKRIGALVLAGLFTGVVAAPAAELPKMKFKEVRKIAPGVYFRYSPISPTDPSIFGGSNNIWVVFEDYVAVIDANFPKEAGDVIEAIKKTTDKPIRYVFDTHHHGDHSYGNAVFAKAGASVVAQSNCARLLRVDGPEEFKKAGRGKGGRKDVAASKLKVPDVVFDDKLVLDDGKQRIEFLFFGHAHTAGDGCAYLPRHKILCTGDACVNGAYNFMGHSDSASWIRALDKMQQLDIQLVCPGHGPVAGKDLLEKQKHYFVELRRQVRKGIDAGKSLEDVIKAIDMPWYKEWTGVTPAEANVKHVYDELTGRIMPPDLVEDFGIYVGPSPTKDSPNWKKPRRIIVPQGLMPARLAELKRIAPDVLFVPARDADEAAKLAGEADAVLGFCTPEIIKAGKGLRWIQVGSAGVEKVLSAELVGSNIVLTNTQRIYGPQVADQAMALLLSLTRGVARAHAANGPSGNSKIKARWDWLRENVKPEELHGKTMLVVGLGGIGTQISRRAHAFGMRVMAIDPKDMDRPAFVFSLGKPNHLMDLLPKADVVVLACPLTGETRGLIGAKQLAAMKKTAFLINIARGGIVKTPDLVAALKEHRIAGAGLDVLDSEPLADSHPLWKLPNVVISPHTGGMSAEGRERRWRLWRENVRRFVAGERLLCVVDKDKGY
jgi:phosphoglycerate dehydrogenase-like enzyme/glyoxylase-like metal-dependent hydrolase (beta-lactamase superfamily II)